MDGTRLSLLVRLGMTAALMCGQSAQAQGIHRCKIAGHMVYQATPCAPEPPAAFPAPAAKAAAAPLPAPKKKTLADLLRERDGGSSASSAPREVQGDGADLLRSRMGAL